MHGLEIGSAGQVAFATRGEPGWHNLGTVFDKSEKVTTSQMLDKAYLSKWDVRLAEIQPEDGEVWVTPSFKVVRTNPFEADRRDVLSIVGARYEVVQNEELFSFGDALLDGGGQWETAGSIREGRQVFGSLLLDSASFEVGEDGNRDAVATYLLVVTSHDGTLGVQAMTTPVRVVCQNTLGMALRGVKRAFKMRHTQTIEGRIAVAKDAIGLAHKYAGTLQAEAQALYETEVTNAEFNALVSSLYPEPDEDKKGAYTRWENKVGTIGDIWVGDVSEYGAPNTIEGISGTAWGALNSLTEYVDWYRTPRQGDPTSMFEAQAGFNPVIETEKNRIHAAVLALARDKGANV